MIDCHVIFTEETDREDWLARCRASLEHPDVTLHVHRFAKADERATPRRKRIHEAQDPERWLMFADPDDYAVQPGYNNFIEHLKTFEGNITHPMEVYKPSGCIYNTTHHLVAVRRTPVPLNHPSRIYNLFFCAESVLFPEIAYAWIEHGANTRGGSIWPRG